MFAGLPTIAWWSWLGLMTALPFRAQAGQEILVDEVVAMVNRQAITHSEVWQEAVLLTVQRPGGFTHRLEVSPENFGETLEMLINQRVLLDEAQRLGLPPVVDQEKEELLQGFRKRFPDTERYTQFLLEHDINEDIVAEVLVRHWRVEVLRDKKLRTLSDIREEAIKEYYIANRKKLGNASYRLVREAIRLKLLTQERERMLASWLLDLRKRSDIKVLIEKTPSPTVPSR